MRVALRTGIGVTALLCALLGLLTAIPVAAMTLSARVQLASLSPESAMAVGTAIGWLTLVLLIGLALVVEPTAAKVLFVLAAVVHALTMASDFLNLVQVLLIARFAPPSTSLVPLVSLGWLWTLSSVLFAAGIVLGFRSQRWLCWLSVGALVLSLAGGFDSTFGIAGELTHLAVLAGIAYVLLARQQQSPVTVEQAYRADAGS